MGYLRDKHELKTGYQESEPWSKKIDLQCDFVMVYGFSDDLEQRVQVFKNQGYIVQFMTGISWGNYQDYLNGHFDGISHWDDAQMDEQGKYIIHGTSEDIPYMVPTDTYINYMYFRLRKVVDLGIHAIHLEEPEFWSHAGYSKSFKKAYEIEYGKSWSNPSCDDHVMYQSQMLKAKLYARALDQIAKRIKSYAKNTYHVDVSVFVPTHSLLNYTQWKIMSPESQLIGLKSIDGFIAQVWTGTSREPNTYQGVTKERTFETALMEYSMMKSFKSERQRVWFLNDPIEDNPTYSWDNYQFNYEKTLVAALLNTTVNDYEICPWPTRIFNRKLPLNQEHSRYIPDIYDRYLNQIFQMLGDIPITLVQNNDKFRVAILMSDTAMYQRQSPDEIDLTFSSFYGLTLPIIKRGVFVEFVTIEKLMVDETSYNSFDLLIMSYDFLKPTSPSFHDILANLMKSGKSICYVGDHQDRYFEINSLFGFNQHPFDHLKSLIDINTQDQEIKPIGHGYFSYMNINPKEIALSKEKHDIYISLIDKIFHLYGMTLSNNNYFHVKRGPYEIISVMDECLSKKPFYKEGLYANLTSLTFEITHQIEVNVNQIGIYYDLASSRHGDIIGTSFRIIEQHITHEKMLLKLGGREALNGHIRIYLNKKPREVSEKSHYDDESSTLLIHLVLRTNEHLLTIIY